MKLPDDLHFGNIAPAVCHGMKVPGAIVIVVNENGTMSMASHGIPSHARRNDLLSMAIHINLGDMEEAMRKGAAGPELREAQAEIDNHNEGIPR